MADKGIIFSAPMVRALLDGRKTQTRRLLNPQPQWIEEVRHTRYLPGGLGLHWPIGGLDQQCGAPVKTPYAPADRLYVREAFSVRGIYSDVVEVGYRAHERASHTEFVEQWPVENAVDAKGKRPKVTWPAYRPSIHMPRWVSRLTLLVSEVRVERLQSISEADAIAEGIDDAAIQHFGDPVKAYAGLWNHLHGAENDHSWEANPWVVAVSFEVVRQNIDSIRSEAA